MNNEYTTEELKLLAGEIKKATWDINHVIIWRSLIIDRNRCAVLTELSADAKYLMTKNYEDMPLYINSEIPQVRAVAHWRLKVGK